MKTVISKNAPVAIGPYSHAVISRGFAFVSGQVGFHPQTGEITDDNIKGQTEQALENLKAVLQSCGSGIEQVIKTTCFLADISDFVAFNEIYSKYFQHKPARSCFAVKDLPKGARVEIEAIAEVGID